MMQRRRAIRTLLVFVPLGVVTTVLTSWAIHAAYFWSFDRRGMSRDPGGVGLYRGFSEAQWDAIAITPTEADEARKLHEYSTGLYERFGWKRTREFTFISWDQGGERFFHPEELTLTDCGWPAMSLRQWYYQRDQDWPHPIVAVAQTPGLSLHGGIQAWPDAAHPWFKQTRFALPLLPLWPGFAINTVFYALLLFIAWRTPGVVRRTRRRRRGRCAACGYDRGGLDADAACPECGAGFAQLCEPTHFVLREPMIRQ